MTSREKQIEEFMKLNKIERSESRMNKEFSKYISQSRKSYSLFHSHDLACAGGRSARAPFDLKLKKINEE